MSSHSQKPAAKKNQVPRAQEAANTSALPTAGAATEPPQEVPSSPDEVLKNPEADADSSAAPAPEPQSPATAQADMPGGAEKPMPESPLGASLVDMAAVSAAPETQASRKHAAPLIAETPQTPRGSLTSTFAPAGTMPAQSFDLEEARRRYQQALHDDKATIYDEDMPKRKKSRLPKGGYYLECFLREVITNIKRNPLMSIASVSTVMVLTLILSFFTIIVANLEALAGELAGEMQIRVYMTDDFDPQTVSLFKGELLKIGHVEGATFVPKDEAFKKLRERLNAKLDLDDLENNPLPDAFTVPVDDPQYLAPVAHKIALLAHVGTVDYGREEANKLMALNKVIRIVGFIILAMLFAATLLIVSNTIRLTVFARRKEIDIMQLVGAADWFIRWPFILEGVVHGAVGAGMSAVLTDTCYRMVVPGLKSSISFLPIMEPAVILPYLNIGIITLGCLVGALGSLISVNHHLKA